jgi:hypothetical protein
MLGFFLPLPGEKVWGMRGKYKLIIPDNQVKYWTYLEEKEL